MVGKSGPDGGMVHREHLSDRGNLGRVHRGMRDAGAEPDAQYHDHETAARKPACQRTKRATTTAGVHGYTVGGYLSE